MQCILLKSVQDIRNEHFDITAKLFSSGTSEKRDTVKGITGFGITGYSFCHMEYEYLGSSTL